MNGKYKWSKSGLELLNQINVYIESHGGVNELLRSIRDDEHKARAKQYQDSLIKPGRKTIFYAVRRRMKKVVFTDQSKFKIFNSCISASQYFGVSRCTIRNAIKKNCKCKGWNVRYAKTKKVA